MLPVPPGSPFVCFGYYLGFEYCSTIRITTEEERLVLVECRRNSAIRGAREIKFMHC